MPKHYNLYSSKETLSTVFIKHFFLSLQIKLEYRQATREKNKFSMASRHLSDTKFLFILVFIYFIQLRDRSAVIRSETRCLDNKGYKCSAIGII